MKIGVPKEIKNLENRVAMTPDNVKELVRDGHEVWIETNAGLGSSFTDEAYREAGATICDSAEEVWTAEMVVKVKEPLESEYKYFYDGLILFTYLHLAAAERLTQELIDSGVTAIAYETIEKDGKLPLLTPMSEVAGRMAVQAGAHHLEKVHGGKGIFLGAVPGVRRANVVIIGGGVVGMNAARIAHGMRANVTVLDINPSTLDTVDDAFNGQVETLMSTQSNIARVVKEADLVVTGVLIAGAKAPTLITEKMIQSMEAGSVVVDIAIDQGGNVETSTHATTHEDPVYTKHGVLHYTVANIPGAVPRTSTAALTNVTLPYTRTLARKGVEEAARTDASIQTGINTYQKQLTNKAVADTFNFEYVDIKSLL